jgi:uncharacterized protein with GYD domain
LEGSAIKAITTGRVFRLEDREDRAMPKYLFVGSYTHEGARGLAKEGAAGRRAAVAKLAESAGGKLESFYFGFGADDFYITVDLPDHLSAAAVAVAAAQSGAVSTRTVALMTPEDMDAALKKTVHFRPPGA